MLNILWTATLQGLGVLLVAWLLLRVFRGMVPSRRQALWWIACLKFPLGLLWLTPIALPILPGVGQAYEPNLVQPTGPTPFAGMVTAGGESGFPWTSALLVVWALGTAFFLVSVIQDAVHLRRLVRNGNAIAQGSLAESLRVLSARIGLSRPPALVESADVSSPMVVGFFNPTVVVPFGFGDKFGEAEREMALAHELAHLHRHDLWTGLIPTAARALFWFLPPVHWATREWETEREAACDAEAIALTHAAPPTYGRLLLNIVAKDDRRPVASAIGATAGFHTLKRRLAKIGQPDRPVPAFAFVLPVLAFLPWLPVASAAPAGLLKNSDLEGGDNDQPLAWNRGPRINTVKYVWDRQVAHGGSASLAIFKTADRYFPIAEWSQSIDATGKGPSVEVTAWVKAEAMHKAVIDVQFLKEDGIFSHAWASYIGAKQYGDPPANHDWKRVGAIVKIPAGTTEIVIAPQVYGPGKVWFDDIDVRFTQEPPTKEVLR